MISGVKPLTEGAAVKLQGASTGATTVRAQLVGVQQQLATTELRVFVQDHLGELCDAHTCQLGSCVCSDGANCTTSPVKVCRCRADVVGETCATELLEDRVHLPQDLGRMREAWRPERWREMLAALAANQDWHAVSNWKGGGQHKFCGTMGRPKVYAQHGNVGLGGRGAGLASSIHFLSGYLSEAFLEGKPLVFYGELNYASNSFCKRKSVAGAQVRMRATQFE
ncbi:hypothetical protein CYMTET_36518, partial [Cymbomonas tetramitiformis]